MSYKIKDIFLPYIGTTYLYSIINPYPCKKGLIRYPYPYQDIIDDFIFNDSKNNKKWGIVVGFSIISSNKISLNVESRFLTEQALSGSMIIRF